jgi:spore coat polysaccharide biosynthesis protein SpsF
MKIEKKNLNVVTIIQARMNSSRLPGKVIMSLAGKPLLIRMYERVQQSKLAGKIIVAVTTDPDDQILVNLCNENKIMVFRGSPTDLLDRHYQAALLHNADAVVKIPSDCPLIDPKIIDEVIGYFLDNYDTYDYVSNLHPPTWPDGNDVEIMKMSSLKKAWLNAKRLMEREHTTPYFWENSSDFKIGNISWNSGLDYSMTYRFTIDYKEDYDFIKRVYAELFPINKNFSLNDIIRLLEENPEIKKINEKYNGVNWYRNHLDELKTVGIKNTKII